MNNSILGSMGISDPGVMIIIMLVLIIVLAVMLVFLLIRYNRLETSYQMFMKGRKAESLEEEIGALFDDISGMKTQIDKNKKDIKKIVENLANVTRESVSSSMMRSRKWVVSSRFRWRFLMIMRPDS